MSIQKHEYELSVWFETLDEKGIVAETKDLIIAAHDMTYPGAARGLIFETKLNGTHELTFEMPDSYYDSLTGGLVHNSFVDGIYNETKLKLRYRGDWYEFIVKNVSDTKHHKSLMKKYICTDAFIDELSRNGYGITFDTELHNNVEEMGTFTREILDGSAWEYSPQYNWGDFTEYLEEKLFRIPLRMFNELEGVKLDFSLKSNEVIENIYTHKKRPMELGDDLAATVDDGYFWDDKNHNNPLMKEILKGDNIPNDGYIYVPYSQLQFCYKTSSEKNIAATEEVCSFKEGGENLSYAIAPKTVDPTALIQFIAIPDGAAVEIDEAGLIVSKEFSYVMTVEQWNKNVKSNQFYRFLPEKSPKSFEVKNSLTFEDWACGNLAVGYEGYLDKIGETDVVHGKKISISDRTEINVSKEIDQFVTVYQNDSSSYEDLYEDNSEWNGGNADYRVCSEIATRQIIPQLARNLFQNGTQIKSIDGWEPQLTPTDGTTPLTVRYYAPQIELIGDLTSSELDSLPTETSYGSLIVDCVAALMNDNDGDKFTLINFGAIGQEEELSNKQIYCFGINFAPNVEITKSGAHYVYDIKDNIGSFDINKMSFICGEGGAASKGLYIIKDAVEFNFGKIIPNPQKYFKDGYIQFYFLFKLAETIKKPYIAIKNLNGSYAIQSCELFKAYTKGRDFFNDEEGIVGDYRYSGRDLFDKDVPTDMSGAKRSDAYDKTTLETKLLFETDIMAGDTYEHSRYFIQQGEAGGEVVDTFGKKSIMGIDDTAIFDESQYDEEQCKIATKYIDLAKCPHYQGNTTGADCSYGGEDHICLYQKYGYCPYLFTSEKHCRKVRTLKGEKSNRFNLTQELSKVFEMYPIYHINHSPNGKTETRQDEDGNTVMKKQIFYIKEKGQENQLGFRYEKNLSSISRSLKSDAIVTKLYVLDVDSEISKTGLSSIKTAEDNVAKDSFIINFDYYTKKGMLDKDMVLADLYGVNEEDMGYLQQLGHFNEEYDQLDNAIINLQNSSTTELEANLEVNLNGIDAAKKEIHRLTKQRATYTNGMSDEELKENKTYINYCTKINELQGTLRGLVYETFISEEKGKYYEDFNERNDKTKTETIDAVIEILDEHFPSIDQIKDSVHYKDHLYKAGMLGQFNADCLQIQEWKKARTEKLKAINKISLEFFRKYEPFLKEGTWSDSNYVDDNAYYFGACEVAAQGSIPKVEYNISVVDLDAIPGNEEYRFDIADITYVEDEAIFGINKITGLPNRLKVIISGITQNLDDPSKNSIKVQNFTTQFEDLFQQVTAMVQNLSFNENIYRRATNFAANKAIKNESLQGALDTNELTLIKTEENNIEIDKTGQSGSDINNHNNKYKLIGEGLFFSNNGGETWNTGVGPGGINADYIKAGTLDAGKVRIVDGDYLYFLWDKEGIFAYRDPDSTSAASPLNDYALFNKYGLSLVQQNQIRLRAGYSFNENSDNEKKGNINNELGLGSEIGFYLYDKEGNPIFATQAEDKGAAIALKGEIFVTDADISKNNGISKIYSYSGDCYEIKTTTSGGYVRNNYISAFSDTVTNISNPANLVLTLRRNTFSVENIGEYILYAANQISPIDLTTKTIEINYTTENICTVRNISLTQTNSIIYGATTLYQFTLSFEYQMNGESNYISLNDTLPEIIFFKPNDTNWVTNLQGVYYKQMNGGITSSSIVKVSGTRTKITDQEYKKQSFQVEQNGEIITLTGYYDGSKYYYTTCSITESIIDNSNKIIGTALYLNNKNSAGEERNENERLICCATNGETKDSTTNIFSILKNGYLYMGGNIKTNDGVNITDPAKVPDNITIDNEFLRISLDKNGNKWGMYMRFDSFYDLESGNNLFDAINEKIASMKLIRHRHPIKEFNAKVDSKVTNKNKQYMYLPIKYSNLQSVNQDITSQLTMAELILGLSQGGRHGGILFDTKVLIADENYNYECTDSYTDYMGGISDNAAGTDSGNGYLLNPYKELI